MEKANMTWLKTRCSTIRWSAFQYPMIPYVHRNSWWQGGKRKPKNSKKDITERAYVTVSFLQLALCVRDAVGTAWHSIRARSRGSIWAALRTSAKEWQWLAPRCRTAAQKMGVSHAGKHMELWWRLPTINIYQYPRLNFTYGVGTRHFVGIAFVPNLSLSRYQLMVLNLLRASENDTMTLPQNEGWFLALAAWRGPSTTTKWILIFIIRALEGDTPTLQCDDWTGLDFLIFAFTCQERKWDWF